MIYPLYSSEKIVSDNDPYFTFIRQQFRSRCDLSVYVNSPFFNLDDSTFSSKSLSSFDAHIRILPKIEFSSLLPDHNLSIISVSKLQNLTLYFEPMIVNKNYGREYVGTDYSRAGISAGVNFAFLHLSTNIVDLTVGKSPVWWGQSWESSIIQSVNSFGYDNISVKIKLKNVHLDILSGQLGSEYSIDSTGNKNRIKRLIAGHRMSWIPDSKNIIISVGEQILYTGENRSFELIRVNPLIPYVMTALDGDETDSPDNDNTIMFFSGRYILSKGLSPFFEIIVDEYQIDENNVPHALGFKYGISGGNSIYGRNITYELEYTSTSNWTYIHSGQYTNWQNRRHPIGYRYGPDSQSIMALADYWLQPGKLMLFAKCTYLEKGSNNLNTVWASPGTKGDPFPTPPVTRHSLLVTSLKYFHKFGILEAGWSNYPVGNAEIGGIIEQPKGSFFLKAQLVWGFGYDLD